MDVGIHFMNFTLSGGPESLRTHVRRRPKRPKRPAAPCSRAWITTSRWRFTRAGTRCSRATRRSATWPARTETMTLGLLVTGVTYRHPGLLAKIVTTLDVLSGGRAILGIGAAWYEREHRALGVPSPLAERLERLEETSRSACRCSTTTVRTRGGTTDRGDAERAAADSAAASADHDRRRRRAEPLRLVAQYADAQSLPGLARRGAAQARRARRHCEEVGRDRSEIRNTTISLSASTPMSRRSSPRWRSTRRSASSTCSSGSWAPSPRKSSRASSRRSSRVSQSSSLVPEALDHRRAPPGVIAAPGSRVVDSRRRPTQLERRPS